MAYIKADFQTAIDRGETNKDGDLSIEAITKIAYRYAPFFLIEYDGMPPAQMVDYEGVPVRMASPEWIAENIDLEDIMIIFQQGFEKNQLSEKEKKNYEQPLELQENQQSTDGVPVVSDNSGGVNSANHTAMEKNACEN